MTQKERIVKYIKDFGSITTAEAFYDLGISKLTTRISELRQSGVLIKSQKISDKNRYGEPVHYNRYTMEA